jgi:hypothetical protein
MTLVISHKIILLKMLRKKMFNEIPAPIQSGKSRTTGKNLITYLIFVFAVVFLFGLAYSYTPGDEAQKLFVDKKCNMCHTVEVVNIESKKKDATDLSATGNNFNAEFISKYLLKEEKIDDDAHKAVWKGTDEELKTLSEWLASLKSEK